MPGGPELSEKVPEEIYQLVESFRKFIREQKAYKDQKFDVDPILEVGREAEEFMLAFQRVSVDSETNSQLIQQIKDDTTKLLRHAELAYSLLRPYLANNPAYQEQQNQQQNQQQHQLNNQTSQYQQQQQLQNQQQQQNQQMSQTGLNATNTMYQTADSSAYLKSFNKTSMDMLQLNQTTGHHNQFANTSSSKYFAELADQFETRMRAYGEQIKELKMSLDSVIKTYNADELFKWLKKQHETLGEIAAKVYMTHERIMEKRSSMNAME